MNFGLRSIMAAVGLIYVALAVPHLQRPNINREIAAMHSLNDSLLETRVMASSGTYGYKASKVWVCDSDTGTDGQHKLVVTDDLMIDLQRILVLQYARVSKQRLKDGSRVTITIKDKRNEVFVADLTFITTREDDLVLCCYKLIGSQ